MATITTQPGSVTLDGVEFSVKDENPFVDLYVKHGDAVERVQLGFDGTTITVRIVEKWNFKVLVMAEGGEQAYPVA